MNSYKKQKKKKSSEDYIWNSYITQEEEKEKPTTTTTYYKGGVEWPWNPKRSSPEKHLRVEESHMRTLISKNQKARLKLYYLIIGNSFTQSDWYNPTKDVVIYHHESSTNNIVERFLAAQKVLDAETKEYANWKKYVEDFRKYITALPNEDTTKKNQEVRLNKYLKLQKGRDLYYVQTRGTLSRMLDLLQFWRTEQAHIEEAIKTDQLYI